MMCLNKLVGVLVLDHGVSCYLKLLHTMPFLFRNCRITKRRMSMSNTGRPILCFLGLSC